MEMWSVRILERFLGTSVSGLAGAPVVKEELLGDRAWALLESSGKQGLVFLLLCRLVLYQLDRS